MVNFVFDCDFDPKTLEAIQELRRIRKNVLTLQITEISQTLTSLVEMGALKNSEKLSHQQAILNELREKLCVVEKRLNDPGTIHSDELELYLELLSEPDPANS